MRLILSAAITLLAYVRILNSIYPLGECKSEERAFCSLVPTTYTSLTNSFINRAQTVSSVYSMRSTMYNLINFTMAICNSSWVAHISRYLSFSFHQEEIIEINLVNVIHRQAKHCMNIFFLSYMTMAHFCLKDASNTSPLRFLTND